MAQGGPRLAGLRRRQLSESYQSGGEHYDRVRPGYPADAVDWVLSAAASDIVDVGAGTGKFTAPLAARGLAVTAVDPSADMLARLSAALPAVRTITGTAENTGLPDESFDVATVAQAWHWCDPLPASSELARILRPGGRLALIWNQLDVSVPWVHRLTRIIRAGDVHKPHVTPLIGPEFRSLESHLTRWSDVLTPEQIRELAKSRSYYLRADAVGRQRVMDNLSWYFDHLGHGPEDRLELPYLTQCWRAERQSVL